MIKTLSNNYVMKNNYIKEKINYLLSVHEKLEEYITFLKLAISCNNGINNIIFKTYTYLPILSIIICIILLFIVKELYVYITCSLLIFINFILVCMMIYYKKYKTIEEDKEIKINVLIEKMIIINKNISDKLSNETINEFNLYSFVAKVDYEIEKIINFIEI